MINCFFKKKETNFIKINPNFSSYLNDPNYLTSNIISSKMKEILEKAMKIPNKNPFY